jgi:hypothetical protein
VLAAFPTCLYLSLGRHEDVLAVLTRDAVDLPIGVRLAVSADELDRGGGWRTRPGDHAVVGARQIALPDVVIAVARTRAAAIHRFPVDGPSTGRRAALSAPLSRPQRPVDRASADDDTLLATSTAVVRQALGGHETTTAVAGLVGAGRGLTPSGDDALCGILLTLRVLGRMEAHAAVAKATGARLGATTSISAALLAAATDGWAAPPVVRLLARMAGGPEAGAPALFDPEDPDVREVLAIGHTSGADLLTGVAATLDALTATEALHPHNRQGAPRG